jgi:hypothetical protein
MPQKGHVREAPRCCRSRIGESVVIGDDVEVNLKGLSATMRVASGLKTDSPTASSSRSP